MLARNLVVGVGLPERAAAGWRTERATEWLMLTSGTSGLPKIVGHTLDGLAGAIIAEGPARAPERDLGDVLRHPPLRRPADIPARRDRRRIDGAVGARGSHRRSRGTAARGAASPTSPGRRRTGASS